METTDGCTIQTYTSSDGYCWRYRRYPAVGPPRGRVVALHGIQSHGGWYTASCRHLAEAGYAVDFLDRRGSGLNQAARGDTPSFRRLLADIAEFVRQDAAPPFVLGISWGGKLAVALEQFHPGLTCGLLLMTPGVCPRVRPPFRQRRSSRIAGGSGSRHNPPPWRNAFPPSVAIRPRACAATAAKTGRDGWLPSTGSRPTI